MITPCPYCGEGSHHHEYGYVVEPGESPMIDVVEEDEELPKQDLTFDQISCVILKPCGHAFPEKEVEDLYDEIMEFRSLRTERRKCEDPERLKELSFIIEAQEHVVNNRTLEISFEHVNKFDD